MIRLKAARYLDHNRPPLSVASSSRV
jgi:hypothetical protein